MKDVFRLQCSPRSRTAYLHGLNSVLQLIVHRLDSFLCGCAKLGFWSSSNSLCIFTIAEDMEDTLFSKITHYHYHILQSYLPARPHIDYNLRERHHNKI